MDWFRVLEGDEGFYRVLGDVEFHDRTRSERRALKGRQPLDATLVETFKKAAVYCRGEGAGFWRRLRQPPGETQKSRHKGG